MSSDCVFGYWHLAHSYNIAASYHHMIAIYTLHCQLPTSKANKEVGNRLQMAIMSLWDAGITLDSNSLTVTTGTAGTVRSWCDDVMSPFTTVWLNLVSGPNYYW